jgi:MarR family transcriptional regulator, 2-MHQ and catechol-resistance regulon repressor
MASESKAPDGTRIWLLMIKAYHALSAYAAPTLRASGLVDSDFRVLEALLHKGALPVNTIGAKVFLTPGSISVAVDRLHERGLVSRTESSTDRRVRVVELTPKGRRLIERVFADHATEMNSLAADLSPGDRRRLAASLKAMGKLAESRSRTPPRVSMEDGNRK